MGATHPGWWRTQYRIVAPRCQTAVFRGIGAVAGDCSSGGSPTGARLSADKRPAKQPLLGMNYTPFSDGLL